jgi:hypothetical protein
VRISVGQSVAARISIAGPTGAGQGQSVALYAIVSNAGITPAYQWQDSTQSNNWQNIPFGTGPSLDYMPASNGNKVRCLLTGMFNCGGLGTDTSNTLSITMDTVTSTGSTSSQPDSGSVRFFPNPVQGTLHLEGLKLSDDYVSFEIVGMDGGRKLSMGNIGGQTSITVPVTGILKGVYIGVLIKRSGAKTYFEFMKVK